MSRCPPGPRSLRLTAILSAVLPGVFSAVLAAASVSSSLCAAEPEPVPDFAAWKARPRPASYPEAADYVRVLSRWPAYAESDWRAATADPMLAHYGPGDSVWGVMAHASALFGYAQMATEPGYRPPPGGPDRERLLARLRQGLRYLVRSHVTGDIRCSDGRRWSDARGAWHSATWAENMAAAADLAWERLDPEIRAGVRRVLVHEAERLSRLRIPSGDFANTQAESNAWNASVLARASVMLADDPRRARWRRKAIEWAMNTLSVPQDAIDDRLVDGRAVREWVSTVNVHRSFASENHGYYHVGYMWWPMWCLASAHFAFTSHGETSPEGLFHHWRDCFGVVARGYIGDGRFAYVSGKDWPRWNYGLTAAVPAYVVLADHLGETAARAMERDAFLRYEWEQLAGGDGSFLGLRLAALKTRGGSHFRAYCRYEADQAIMLGLALALHRRRPPTAAPDRDAVFARLRGGVRCPDAQILFRRDDERVAGWSWKTRAGRPQGTLATPRDPAACEWEGNLCGRIALAGERASRPLVTARADALVEGGLWAVGTLEWGASSPADQRAADALALTVSDDNVRGGDVVAPDHPVFRVPHRVRSLRALTDPDSLSAHGDGWRVLARNARGQASVVEATIGKGCYLICMASADTAYRDAAPGGELFENLVAWARRGREDAPLGYVRGIHVAREALSKLGREATEIRRLEAADLDRFGAIILDRGSAPAVRTSAWRLVRYVEAGGRVLRFCLHDDQFRRQELDRDPPRGAVRHDVAFFALPDGRTVALSERAVARRDVTVAEAEALSWHIGNDLFNGGRRRLRTRAGERTVTGPGGETREVAIDGSWVEVDGHLALACRSDLPLSLLDRGERAAPYLSHAYETLRLRAGPSPAPAAAPRKFAAGETVFSHLTCIATAASPGAGARLAAGLREVHTSSGLVRAAVVPGADARRFLVAWNLSREAAEITDATLSRVGLAAGPGAGPGGSLRVPALSAAVREIGADGRLVPIAGR